LEERKETYVTMHEAADHLRVSVRTLSHSLVSL
jgi:hypothetical protein